MILGMLITFLLCTGLSYDENQKGGEEKKEETTGEEKSYENPQILCPEPDGENGWFQTKPQIQIIHTERQAIVSYELKCIRKNNRGTVKDRKKRRKREVWRKRKKRRCSLFRRNFWRRRKSYIRLDDRDRDERRTVQGRDYSENRRDHAGTSCFFLSLYR